ncbi:MAG: heme exporter protein CcmB [Alphaproteobacteria bacterium]|nr:heme exporter protein CcmB [Alphaproteobacteria bacterium]OJV12220.1 MAG: hypothetical protein BGO27_05735 [Alphaproteobacteria bacterium 33-17]
MHKFWLLLIRDAACNRLLYKIAVNTICLIIIHIIFSFSIPLDILHKSAQSIFTVGMVLVLLLSLDQIAADDIKDGTIDLLVSMKIKYKTIVLFKSINHFIAIMLPIAIVEFLVGFMFYKMDISGIAYSVALKLMVMPTISLVSVMTSFATSGMRSVSMLFIFYFPLIIAPMLLINIAGNSHSMLPALMAYGGLGLLSLGLMKAFK